MRNIVPLTTMGCIAVVILGTIAAGIIMLGVGAMPYIDKLRKNEQPTVEFKQKQPVGPAPLAKDPGSLLSARANFKTQLRESNYQRRKGAPELINGVTNRQYSSPAGPLVAYVSKDQGDGKKRPAVVWVHSGHGGIGPDTWNEAKFFEDAGFVAYCPSFRGENNNPGEFEMFYGEVDDLLAAIEDVAGLDYVDSNRIYVIGHNAGGTLTLLAAVTGTQKARAFFAISGYPNFGEHVSADPNIDPTPPFDPKRRRELELRSASPFFVGAIQSQTFYFEAFVRAVGRKQGEVMQVEAQKRSVLFRSFGVPRANPDTLLKPMLELIVRKIKDSEAQSTPIHFDLSRDILPQFPK